MIGAVNEQRREVEQRQGEEAPEDFGDQVVGFFETALTIQLTPRGRARPLILFV
jgi:hypothetical protein